MKVSRMEAEFDVLKTILCCEPCFYDFDFFVGLIVRNLSFWFALFNWFVRASFENVFQRFIYGQWWWN